jgi:hypothetical protein
MVERNGRPTTLPCGNGPSQGSPAGPALGVQVRYIYLDFSSSFSFFLTNIIFFFIAGRPGWHIECSVMASAILGRVFRTVFIFKHYFSSVIFMMYRSGSCHKIFINIMCSKMSSARPVWSQLGACNPTCSSGLNTCFFSLVLVIVYSRHLLLLSGLLYRNLGLQAPLWIFTRVDTTSSFPTMTMKLLR